MDNRKLFKAWLCKFLGFDVDDEKLNKLLFLMGKPINWPNASYASAVEFWEEQYTHPNVRNELIRLLVNNESYFFREPFCFCFLQSEMAHFFSNTMKPFSILSVGCSAGQEIYSCAILAHKMFGNDFGQRVTLYGVDVDEITLTKAKRGIFSNWDMRGLSPSELKLHFCELTDNSSELAPHIRDKVTFAEQNIFSPWNNKLPSEFDFIFCRNLLVHFAPTVRADCIKNLVSLVKPGGALVFAAAEMAALDIDGFSQEEHEDYFYFRKIPGADLTSQREKPTVVSTPVPVSTPAPAPTPPPVSALAPASISQIPAKKVKSTVNFNTSVVTTKIPDDKKGVRESASAYRETLAAMKHAIVNARTEQVPTSSFNKPSSLSSKSTSRSSSHSVSDKTRESSSLAATSEQTTKAPVSVVSDRELVFTRNLKSCFEKYSEGDIQEALSYCDLCLKQKYASSPEEEGSFLVIKGLSLKALGNTNEAATVFERSAFLLPLSWTASFFHGECEADKKDTSKAAKSFARAYKCLGCDDVPYIDVLFLEDLPKDNMKSVCVSRLESFDCRHLIETCA